jgi:TfoX/Sxy family transcriptional regulator of competence genes
MAYSEELLQRIRRVLAHRKDVVEKKMFGSVAFMVRGNMACGPHGESLIVRIGNEAAAKAMEEPHVKPMDFTGKVLKSFAEIQPPGIRTDAQLSRWVLLAAEYAAATLKTQSRRRPSSAAAKKKK